MLLTLLDCGLRNLRCFYIRSSKSQVSVEARDLREIPEYFPAGTTSM